MPKVMLIEDDQTMLSLLSTLLEMEGYQVVRWEYNREVITFDDILHMIHRAQPDLLLLDVHLRDLSGIELLRQMRKDAALQETRVLMSSGMDLDYQCRQAGANGFILKPYMPDELVGSVKKLLGNH